MKDIPKDEKRRFSDEELDDDPDFVVEDLQDDTEEDDEDGDKTIDNIVASQDRGLDFSPSTLQRIIEDLPDDIDEPEWQSSDGDEIEAVSRDNGQTDQTSGLQTSKGYQADAPAGGAPHILQSEGDSAAADEADAISRRTRANMPLNQVTIEELERLLIEPDFDEDLRECDGEYSRFLEFTTTGLDLPDDDEEDEDFTVDLDELLDDGGDLPSLRGPGRPRRAVRPLEDRMARFDSRLCHRRQLLSGLQAEPAGQARLPSFSGPQMAELHAQLHQHSQLLIQSYILALYVNPGEMSMDERLAVAGKVAELLQAMVDASAAQSKAKEEAGAPQLPPALIGLVVVPHAHMEAYGDSVDRGIQPWRPVCMEPPRSVMDITVLRMLDPLLRTVRNVSAQRDTERFVRHSGNRIKAGTKLLGFVPPLLQAALATYRGIFDPRLEPVQPKRKVAHSQWTPAEDELFARGIRTYGLDFVLIQKHCLPSKTVPQLRLRAKNSRRYPSNPVHKAKRDVQEPLSAEEIDAIRKALRIYGRRYNRWELISKECVPRVPPTMLPRVWAAVCSDAIGKKPSPSGRRKGVAQKRSADCRGAGGAAPLDGSGGLGAEALSPADGLCRTAPSPSAAEPWSQPPAMMSVEHLEDTPLKPPPTLEEGGPAAGDGATAAEAPPEIQPGAVFEHEELADSDQEDAPAAAARAAAEPWQRPSCEDGGGGGGHPLWERAAPDADDGEEPSQGREPPGASQRGEDQRCREKTPAARRLMYAARENEFGSSPSEAPGQPVASDGEAGPTPLDSEPVNGNLEVPVSNAARSVEEASEPCHTMSGASHGKTQDDRIYEEQQQEYCSRDTRQPIPEAPQAVSPTAEVHALPVPTGFGQPNSETELGDTREETPGEVRASPSLEPPGDVSLGSQQLEETTAKHRQNGKRESRPESDSPAKRPRLQPEGMAGRIPASPLQNTEKTAETGQPGTHPTSRNDGLMIVNGKETRWTSDDDRAILMLLVQHLQSGTVPGKTEFENLANHMSTPDPELVRTLEEVEARYQWLKDQFLERMPK